MKLEETKEYKEYILQRKEKQKSMKSGKDVVHLSYYKNLFSEQELSDLKTKIEKINLEFSSYDQSGDITGFLDNYSLDVFFVLSQITLHEILTGTITNATWETLKYVIVKIWNKTKGKTLTKYTSKTSEKKKMNFGMKVNLDKNTHFNFHLKGEINEETLLKSLDKTFDFIKSQKKNTVYKLDDYVEFDSENNIWVAIDVEKEIRKKALKKKRK